jgi:hypothetical protein
MKLESHYAGISRFFVCRNQTCDNLSHIHQLIQLNVLRTVKLEWSDALSQVWLRQRIGIGKFLRRATPVSYATHCRCSKETSSERRIHVHLGPNQLIYMNVKFYPKQILIFACCRGQTLLNNDGDDNMNDSQSNFDTTSDWLDLKCDTPELPYPEGRLGQPLVWRVAVGEKL